MYAVIATFDEKFSRQVKFIRVMEFVYKEFSAQKADLESLKLIKVNYENDNPVSCNILAEYNFKRMETSI